MRKCEREANADPAVCAYRPYNAFNAVVRLVAYDIE